MLLEAYVPYLNINITSKKWRSLSVEHIVTYTYENFNWYRYSLVPLVCYKCG